VAALEEKHTEAVRKHKETLSMMREERKQRDLSSDADFARSEQLQSQIAALQVFFALFGWHNFSDPI
jgi:hypothetical protein